MKTKNAKIKCPKCDTTLSVNELLIDQFQESIRKDLESELQRREDELNLQRQENREMTLKLQQEKEDVDELVNERVKSIVKSREDALKNSIRNEVQQEKSKQLQELEDELKSKSAQLIELNQTKAKMERLSREFEEREAKIHLQKERELSERLEAARVSMKEEIQMESFLKIKEKENIIESLKHKLDDARQRASQGSMQMQGEAQELLLEEMLRDLHSHDVIQEIGKGVNGADCLQTVRTQTGIEAGRILYESKNTKAWSDGFVKKLKQDNLVAKADIMVIITKSMPKDVKGKYALIDGVWITELQNVKDLSLMLRFGLLKTHSVVLTQTGKKDKMSMLYDYLTSEDFRATFESILEGFKSLQDSHNDEQRKIQLLWKKRAKYLEQVLGSTIEFYGSIKGISGDAIGDLALLDFPMAS